MGTSSAVQAWISFQFSLRNEQLHFGSAVGCSSSRHPTMSPIPPHWERPGIGRGLAAGRTHDYLPDDDEVSLVGSEASTEPDAEAPPQSPDPTPCAADADARPVCTARPPGVPSEASISQPSSRLGNTMGQGTTSSPAASALPCEGSQDYAYEPFLMIQQDPPDEIDETGPLPSVIAARCCPWGWATVPVVNG